jgi:hypothetical protein
MTIAGMPDPIDTTKKSTCQINDKRSNGNFAGYQPANEKLYFTGKSALKE